jgi:hypothetical protein
MSETERGEKIGIDHEGVGFCLFVEMGEGDTIEYLDGKPEIIGPRTTVCLYTSRVGKSDAIFPKQRPEPPINFRRSALEIPVKGPFSSSSILSNLLGRDVSKELGEIPWDTRDAFRQPPRPVQRNVGKSSINDLRHLGCSSHGATSGLRAPLNRQFGSNHF